MRQENKVKQKMAGALICAAEVIAYGTAVKFK